MILVTNLVHNIISFKCLFCLQSMGQRFSFGFNSHVCHMSTVSHLCWCPLKMVQKLQLVQNMATHVVTGHKAVMHCWAASPVAALVPNLFPGPIQGGSWPLKYYTAWGQDIWGTFYFHINLACLLGSSENMLSYLGGKGWQLELGPSQ